MERYARIAGIRPAFISKMLERWPLVKKEVWDKYGARWTLGWLLRQNSEHLQELCIKHALKSSGKKEQLVQRMYLHDRSSRLLLGDPRIGYGPHHEAIRIPTCECGRHLRKEVEEAMTKKRNKRAERLERNSVKQRRFPRLKKHPRS